MARIDQSPEDRDTRPLQVEAVYDCEECGAVFDHVFTAPPGVFEYEDLMEAPVEMVTCPGCGKAEEREWTGWTSHGDAG